jgi:hypothetical protein
MRSRKPYVKREFALRIVILAVLIFQVQLAYPCSQAIGYFHQITRLRGTVVGTNRGWPRWVRERVTGGGVNLRLYEYRWPVRDPSEMPLVKTVTADNSGQFDFGILQDGHYTLFVDWPSQYANRFDVEIKKLPRPTSSVKIDVSPIYPDCSGGHEFIAFSD